MPFPFKYRATFTLVSLGLALTTTSGDIQADTAVHHFEPSPLVEQPTTVSQVDNAESSAAKNAQVEKSFLAFLDNYAKEILRRSPLTATRLGVTTEYLGTTFNDRLDDLSPASVKRQKASNAAQMAHLQSIDRNRLSGVAQSTYDSLLRSLTMASNMKPYVNAAFSELGIFSPFLISQIAGPHINIPRSLQAEHPLRNRKDAEDYIIRLSQFNKLFSNIALLVAEDAQQGILPPQFAVQGALNFIEQFMAAPAQDNPLVSTFATRIKESGALSEQQQADLVKKATAALNNSVYPGYQSLKVALEALLPKASPKAGIWDLKDGAKRYQLALENFGAGGKTAEQIHQIGLSEVDRIQTAMDVILKAQGLSEGPIMDRYLSLTKNPAHLYPNTDGGRQALLDDLNQQMDNIQGLLPNILLTLPKAKVEIRRIAEYEQDGAPGGYYTSPSLDGSRPGIYWINLKNTADWAKFTLPTLTYHEASPGHHLQIAIAQQIQNMPMIRNLMWYSAYGEGWALYAEVLAKELGLYKNDPLGDLGRLQSELFRAARLVVDTGLHHKRWSREKAIQYMVETLGDTEASVTREVERYSVWPGQACSYKLGQIKLLELREMAQATLKDKFDLREFNDQVLIRGSVPLAVLEQNILDWVASKQ